MLEDQLAFKLKMLLAQTMQAAAVSLKQVDLKSMQEEEQKYCRVGAARRSSRMSSGKWWPIVGLITLQSNNDNSNIFPLSFQYQFTINSDQLRHIARTSSKREGKNGHRRGSVVPLYSDPPRQSLLRFVNR